MTAVTTPRHAAGKRPGWTQFKRSWRSSADEARSDRLVTASVGLVGAVMGAAAALFAKGTTAAVCVGLMTLCVTPGCALVCWLSTRERLTRVVTVLAASLTWTILVTSLLAWFRVTSLGVLLMVTAGLGGIGSAVFLTAQLARYLKRLPVVTSVDEGENASAWALARVDAHPRSFAALRRSLRLNVPLVSYLLLLSAAAAGLLAIAVIQARGRTVGSYGLLPLLGTSFFASVVLTIGVLVLALRFVRTAWPAAVVALALLLVEFNGTPMMLDPTPLSSWTYKHFGVVEYLVHGGALTDPFDIYQQWPGFFAAAAGLVHLSGLSPLTYANWAQLFFEMLDGLVLFAIAHRFSQKNRTVPYITVLLFITANWEGQFYYSPQTTGFLLALLFQFFLLALLKPTRLRRPFLRIHWLSALPLAVQRKEQIHAAGTAVRAVGLVAIFGALTITHQISPYFVFAGVACLWALGVLRHLPIVMALAVMLLGYTLLHLPALDQNNLLTGFSVSNATGSQGLANSPEQVLASISARAISLGLWAATAICVLSYRRRLGVVAIPAILAAAPFVFLLVTNYDGEAIYRVFLFSSPWCALIIAKRLADLVIVPMLRLAAVGVWALFAALGSAQAQDFGMYPMLQVPLGEIQASAYFLDHAPPNSMLVEAVANFPARLNGRYVLHNVMQGQNDPSLDEVPELAGSGLEHANPKAVAISVASMADGKGYLVIAPSMQRDVDYYGVFTPGTLPALVPRLEGSPYWQVWYENDDTVILRAWPQGRPAATTHRHRREGGVRPALHRNAANNSSRIHFEAVSADMQLPKQAMTPRQLFLPISVSQGRTR
jgi:hypothetical protein